LCLDHITARHGLSGPQLLTKIDEQRRRYETFHGINVEVRADRALAVSNSAGVEAYQVVCEALSNVVRHTSAKRAFVDLRCDGNNLAIEVGNDSSFDNPRNLARIRPESRVGFTNADQFVRFSKRSISNEALAVCSLYYICPSFLGLSTITSGEEVSDRPLWGFTAKMIKKPSHHYIGATSSGIIGVADWRRCRIPGADTEGRFSQRLRRCHRLLGESAKQDRDCRRHADE
jgi:hypothetical protein